MSRRPDYLKPAQRMTLVGLAAGGAAKSLTMEQKMNMPKILLALWRRRLIDDDYRITEHGRAVAAKIAEKHK